MSRAFVVRMRDDREAESDPDFLIGIFSQGRVRVVAPETHSRKAA
jgi:hypothetical protein